MTNNYDSKITGEIIAELRKEKELTQENLAKELHIDSSLIGHYERGRKMPIDMLCKIAEYFETTTDYLLGLTKCKTTKSNYRTLCDLIGLDDTALEILEDINFVYEGKKLIPIINFLIKQEKLPPDEAFFEGIYSKIENSNMTDKEKKKYIRKVQSIYDRNYQRWKDKNYQAVLSNIEDYFITDSEDTNLCLMLSGELKEEGKITNEIDKLYIRKKIPKKQLLEKEQLEEINESCKEAKQQYKNERKIKKCPKKRE